MLAEGTGDGPALDSTGWGADVEDDVSLAFDRGQDGAGKAERVDLRVLVVRRLRGKVR